MSQKHLHWCFQGWAEIKQSSSPCKRRTALPFGCQIKSQMWASICTRASLSTHKLLHHWHDVPPYGHQLQSAQCPSSIPIIQMQGLQESGGCRCVFINVVSFNAHFYLFQSRSKCSCTPSCNFTMLHNGMTVFPRSTSRQVSLTQFISIEQVPHHFITASQFKNQHSSGLWQLCPSVLVAWQSILSTYLTVIWCEHHW